jgi:hypothetical protein
MLVICYGIAKSGSTLAYELVKGVLADAGHSQKKVRSLAIKPKARGNHLAELSRDALLDTMAAIGDERIVAAKTHMAMPGSMFPWLEEMQQARKLQVFASYRDPRDICLSLVDHGVKSRDAGRPGFSRIHALDDAADVVERAIAKFRQWAALKGSARLSFDTVAFAPDDAIAAIEARLGVKADREAVKRHAFEDAFTQKNKARRHRYEDELDAADRARLSQRFAEFIERVCVGDDQAWFDACRAEILSDAAA